MKALVITFALMTVVGPLLSIRNLQISINGNSLLKLESLEVNPGEIHGIIGESGSGKSLTLFGVMGLLSPALQISGSIQLNGIELTVQLEKAWRNIRGKEIGMIFQEPMTALNPQMRCGKQLMESALIHEPNFDLAKEKVERKLAQLGLGEILDRILNAYPHQLSGGQRQRVMIAMACVHEPPLILADEPTTALDSVARQQVMRDLERICKEQGSALVWVSHELDLVRQYAEKVTVLRKGVCLAQGESTDVFGNAAIDYVKELIEAMPNSVWVKALEDYIPVLEITDLGKTYQQKGWEVKALNGFSDVLHQGETLAIVGLSGSGKSTLAKMLVALETPTEGSVFLNGNPLKRKPPTGIQMVFQDPYSSLNPNDKSIDAVREVVEWFGKGNLDESNRKQSEKTDLRLLNHEKATSLLEEVGFDLRLVDAYPHEMSGGQRQRLCIARALASDPKVLILDEAVAALDPLVQKQVLDLLLRLQRERGLAYIFITHNLEVARAIAHRIVFLEKGEQQPLPADWLSV
jgi:ABC-type glutathione transport system ATPase component